MYLTLKDSARLLGVSENRVRSYIATGKLAVERKGRQMLIPETELKALAETEKIQKYGEHGANPEAEMVPTASPGDALGLISARLAALENQLMDKWQMVVENQRLHQLLREQDRKLAEKDLELEKLHRDLLYQQRLAEKEFEDHRLAFQERITRMEQEAATRMAQEHELLERAVGRERERMAQALTHDRQSWSEKLAQEREQMEQTLARERQDWSEKLIQEQERFAQMLAAMRNQEGLWARLVRMITWS